MNTQTHVIRRHTLELLLAEGDKAPQLQAEVERLFGDKVLPVIDAVMSSQVGEDEVLRIDRLELELGRIVQADMPAQLPERVREELQHALAQVLMHADSKPVLRSAPARGRNEQRLSTRSNPNRSGLELLEYFLRTGLVPWWHPADGDFDLDGHIAQLLGAHVAALLAVLRGLTGDRVVQRLVMQLKPQTLERLLLAIAGSGGDPLLQEMTQLQAVINTFADVQASHRGLVVYEQILSHLLATEQRDQDTLTGVVVHALLETADRRGDSRLTMVTELRKYTEKYLPADAAVHRRLGDRLKDVIASTHEDPALGDHSTDRSESSTRGRPAGDGDGWQVATSSPSGPDLPEHGGTEARSRTQQSAITVATRGEVGQVDRERQQTNSGNAEDAAAKIDELLRQVPDLADGQYLANAGLVLLWPYLPRFFQQSGLADNTDFHSPSARERGVLLLEYLVCGETEFPESRLMLNKLLCGWPILDPVAREIEPSEIEIREVEELLAAVIAHWQSLRNTSPAGLREAFLHREGRLAHDDMGWQLMVNRTGYDVLLDSLPWGIGLIRLPWMKEALRVEW